MITRSQGIMDLVDTEGKLLFQTSLFAFELNGAEIAAKSKRPANQGGLKYVIGALNPEQESISRPARLWVLFVVKAAAIPQK